MTSKKINNQEEGFKVSSGVQIIDVRLIKCDCEQKPPTDGNIKREYDIKHNAVHQVDKNNGKLIVAVNFIFAAFEEGTDNEILKIDCAFLLSYQISNFEGLVDIGFEQFANTNGVFNAWPYWRELVQNMVGRMNLPPLTLPVYRIVSELPKKEDAKQIESNKSVAKKKVVKKKTSKKKVVKTTH